jgi:glutamine amidotransferase-like uncharacterized protein
MRPYLKKIHHKRGLVVQGVNPEYKSKYCKKKKKKKERKKEAPLEA